MADEKYAKIQAKLDKGELQLADVQAKTKELFDAELAKLN